MKVNRKLISNSYLCHICWQRFNENEFGGFIDETGHTACKSCADKCEKVESRVGEIVKVV